jgi:hypothetical protein
LAEFAEGGQIIGNVLLHIKATNDVELGIIRKCSDVGLAELRTRTASLRDWQCLWIVFQSGYLGVREILRETLQNEAGAASDFQKIPAIGGMRFDRPRYEVIPLFEPKVAFFELCQLGKNLLRIAIQCFAV